MRLLRLWLAMTLGECFMKNVFFYDMVIGKIGIASMNGFVTNIFFERFLPENLNVLETEEIKKAHTQLLEYFSGKRKIFDIKIKPFGTDFQKKVWDALMQVPYGQVCSYKDIAIKIGNEKACRAVGMANNKNPIPLIIPCHRVVGSNGNLVGYAGGIEVKKQLLDIEYYLIR